MSANPQPTHSVSRAGPRVVLFCGGRDCTEESHGNIIRGDLLSLPRGSVVIHGDADGADKIADHWARRIAPQHELHVARVPALWKAYGRGAGPRRNAAILMLRPDLAYAYPTGGRGTQDMIHRLEVEGVHVVVREARA